MPLVLLLWPLSPLLLLLLLRLRLLPPPALLPLLLGLLLLRLLLPPRLPRRPKRDRGRSWWPPGRRILNR